MNSEEGESYKASVPLNKASVMIQLGPAMMPGCMDFMKGLASAEIAGCIEKWDFVRLS